MAFNRRSLLLSSAVTAFAAACSETPSASEASAERVPLRLGGTVECLAAVSDVLLPDDGQGPSAMSLGVRGYLQSAMKREDLRQVHGALERGARFLDGWAQKNHRKAFAQLDAGIRREVVDHLVDGTLKPPRLPGKQFVRVMLALTLEAALGDPRHGGNEAKQGWAWLGYREEGRG